MAPEPRGGDGGRGDISLLKREVSPHAPQRETRGDFDFPPDPLETTRPGGLRAPYSGLHPQNGSGSGKRSRTHTSTSPESRTQGPKCGEHVLCSGAVRRTRRKPSRFLPHGFARPPHLSKKGAFWRRFCAQASFSSTVHGAFFFGKTKKNGGCIPARRSRAVPRPAPGARNSRPGPVGRHSPPPGRPRAAQRHIVPRLTARRPCPYPHLLHF